MTEHFTRDEAVALIQEQIGPATAHLLADRAVDLLSAAVTAKLKEWDQGAVAIELPDYHEAAMGCGLEDRDITDRYEAMRHGWDCAMDRVFEQIPDEPLYTHALPAQPAEQTIAEEHARNGGIVTTYAVEVDGKGYAVHVCSNEEFNKFTAAQPAEPQQKEGPESVK